MDKEISEAIFLLINNKEFFNLPPTTEELYEFLITTKLNGRVSKDQFEKVLVELMTSGKLFKHEEYVWNDERSLEASVLARKEAIAFSRQKFLDLQKFLTKRIYSKGLYFAGVTGRITLGLEDPSGLNLSKQASSGEVVSDSNVKIAVILDKKGFLNNFSSKKFLADIDKKGLEVIILPDDLNWPSKSIFNAFELIALKPVISQNGIYEKIIAKNIWIYDFFSNYPLRKVSSEFRVEIKS